MYNISDEDIIVFIMFSLFFYVILFENVAFVFPLLPEMIKQFSFSAFSHYDAISTVQEKYESSTKTSSYLQNLHKLSHKQTFSLSVEYLI